MEISIREFLSKVEDIWMGEIINKQREYNKSRCLNPNDGSLTGTYIMDHNGPTWSIGYQREVRYFLDDGTHVDFIDDLDGQIRYLMDYIANNGDTPLPQKFVITSEVEFMDI